MVDSGKIPEPMAGGLCYAAGPVSGLVFLIWKRYRHSSFVRFHAWQSIFFSFAALLSLSLVAGAATMLPLQLLMVGQLATSLWMVVLIVCWFRAILQAMNGLEWNLPLVGTMARACR